MPKTAHNRRHRRKVNGFNFRFLYIIFGLIAAFLLFYFFTSSRVWNGQDKVAIGYEVEDSAIIAIIDPRLSEITYLSISGDTQVNLSRNKGVLRLKNVWNFGKNEGSAGQMFVDTLSKNFHIPLYLYSSRNPSRFNDFVFRNDHTNIGFIDRIKIAFFVKSVKSSSLTSIDLSKNLFIKKEKLDDGEMGYKIYENLFERLKIYFNDQYFSDNMVKINLIDATGRYSVADAVGKTLETLGGKIVSVKRLEKMDSYCTLEGGDKIINSKILSMYECKIIKNDMSPNEIKITLGAKFAEEY